MALWGVQGSMQVSLFVIVLAFPRRRCPSRLHCCRLLSPGFVFCPAVLRFRLRTRVSLLSCALYSQYRSSAVPHQRRAALHRDLQVACGGAVLPFALTLEAHHDGAIGYHVGLGNPGCFPYHEQFVFARDGGSLGQYFLDGPQAAIAAVVGSRRFR